MVLTYLHLLDPGILIELKKCCLSVMGTIGKLAASSCEFGLTTQEKRPCSEQPYKVVDKSVTSVARNHGKHTYIYIIEFIKRNNIQQQPQLGGTALYLNLRIACSLNKPQTVGQENPQLPNWL